MTTSPQPESPEPLKVAKKIEPGSELHFALLAVPVGWNFLTGKDYADMQTFAKAVWDAAIQAARNEAEAMRADAERYRFIRGRNGDFTVEKYSNGWATCLSPRELDAAIDDAMKGDAHA
ncbi:hypothetical protein [Variovorax atrisoli]|uniref:hypothetical protein n=1 Tax=Variovorax atrisoli TaxID=3394203 RepID=UPI00035FB6B0|nr:hypothetical protein [Variovorax paradoxus]